MQEAANKQKRMTDEMDINLEVFNLETDFFGDLHCSSRFTDMLCDAQAQYGDLRLVILILLQTEDCRNT